MSIKKHGLTVGIERVANEFFLTLKVSGKLMHDDYAIITPMLDAALIQVKQAKIKALIDCTELEGWEFRAAWDDFQLSLNHGSEFTKIAIYGNKGWQKFAAKLAPWFVSGEVDYFKTESDALAWLVE
ncbi:STAS/SEC14 domain-containing protein [Brumicola pallidula]|uniref:STAS/SEC14 domain-containing protein n=1 Tax=Brumicola pallidula DSM 14239 = ACAM 615 TaxID=1121922 RepID=K6Z334_9ALTE|nr:STAS/SEC14 domain-containing protein [Glaciecola pallidula]GAC30656.1 hypothetical protein GPAL_3816 [Glaciecola pallidula DSM 14239 = ACAM 615]